MLSYAEMKRALKATGEKITYFTTDFYNTQYLYSSTGKFCNVGNCKSK